MDWGGLKKGVLARILVRDHFLLLCVLLFRCSTVFILYRGCSYCVIPQPLQGPGVAEMIGWIEVLPGRLVLWRRHPEQLGRLIGTK